MPPVTRAMASMSGSTTDITTTGLSNQSPQVFQQSILLFVNFPDELNQMIFFKMSRIDRISLASTCKTALSWCRRFEPEIGRVPYAGLDVRFVAGSKVFERDIEPQFDRYGRALKKQCNISGVEKAPNWHLIQASPMQRHQQTFGKRLILFLTMLFRKYPWLTDHGDKAGWCIYCSGVSSGRRARIVGQDLFKSRCPEAENITPVAIRLLLTCSERCGKGLQGLVLCTQCHPNGAKGLQMLPIWFRCQYSAPVWAPRILWGIMTTEFDNHVEESGKRCAIHNSR